MIANEKIELIEKIKNGEITSWEELLFHKILMGYNFSDKELFFHLIKNGYLDETLFDFIVKILGKESSGICDEFITNDIIDIMLYNSRWCTLGNYVPITALLQFVDVRNPRILLRYFLKNTTKTIMNEQYKYNYLTLLNVTLKRTTIRARKNNSYKSFVDLLEQHKKHFIELNRYIQ
jgi:hypothetical protein